MARENYFDTPEPIWLRLFYFHYFFLFVLQFASALSPTFAKTLSLPGDLRANHFQVTFAFQKKENYEKVPFDSASENSIFSDVTKWTNVERIKKSK